MPTPVSSARQCLAGEAAATLDDAVGVARRRCHAQTSSLHVVSALLSLPSTSTSSSSILRDALARARSVAYSSRLQFKALELCFSVALDRLPSSSSSSSSSSAPPGNGQHQSNVADAAASEPPVSNSLMAAIKRSQANQRRNPETFHLYHHHQQQQQLPQSPTFVGVKVELQQLILSILDDPVVSRVFGEAGFRSCDIKYAVLRPPPTSILRFPRPTRCPPLFLCNFSTVGDEYDAVSHREFSFPFSRHSLYSDGSDENCRRIGEVLVKKKGRNPLLVGAGASEALRDLAVVLTAEKWNSLPPEMAGSRFFSLEDLSEFVCGRRERAWLESRINDLISTLLAAAGTGVVVSVGDLKGFLEESGVGGEEEKREGLEFVVSDLSRLINNGGQNGRMWVVGSSASYETYMKFLAKFPSVDKDWDLQLLPITSVRRGGGSSPAASPKLNSLTKSLVPATTTATTTVGTGNPPRCDQCNDKYEEEVAAILKENSVPVAELQKKSSLPTWMQKPPTVGLDNSCLTMTRNDGAGLNDEVGHLQKKWNDTCQRLHHGRGDVFQTEVSNLKQPQQGFPRSESFPRIIGFPAHVSDRPMTTLKTSDEMELELSKSDPSKIRGGSLLRYHTDDRASHSLITVSTDLMLGTVPVSPKPSPSRQTPSSSDLVSMPFSPMNSDVVSVNPVPSPLSLSCSNSPVASTRFSPNSNSKLTDVDAGDFKALYRNLVEKLGRQEEAIATIAEVITRCRAGNGSRRGVAGTITKGDIWLCFLGPDGIGKKRIATSLAELLFRDKDKLIYIDLGLQEGTKMVVDQIAGEISKMQRCSVVLLENLDKADFLVQSSLSHAVKTGRFPDSHGREVSTGNIIFITTSITVVGVDHRRISQRKECSGSGTFSEEKILNAQTRQLKILIESTLKPLNVITSSSSPNSSPTKRKLYHSDVTVASEQRQFGPSEMSKRANNKSTNTRFLDLNMPFEEETQQPLPISNLSDDHSSSDESHCASSSNSSTTASWLEEFSTHVNSTIEFNPIDFDFLAGAILKETTRTFRNTIGSECKFEIDPEAMEHMLFAAWSSDGAKSGETLHRWSENVLGRCLIEARERYNLSSHTTLRLASSEDRHHPCPGIDVPSRMN